jgi:peptidylprolyl isomerase
MPIRTKLPSLLLALVLPLSLAAAGAAAKTAAKGAKPEAKDAPAAQAAAKPPLPDLPAPPDVAAAPADAEKTPSGLASKVLQKGTGTTHPKAGDTVEVNYAGWMTDGKLFDTSQKRGTTSKFPIDLLIKGWQEGLKLMVPGEKRRMWIPANLAYGDTPRRPGGPFGTLVFDVELVSILPPDAAKP